MKKLLLKTKKFKAGVFVILCLVMGLNVKAQTAASVTWPLSSTTTTASTVVGNVTGGVETLSSVMAIKDYAGLSGAQRVNVPATTGGTYPSGWPALQTTELSDVWIEFAVTPNTGLNLTVNSVILSMCGGYW